MIFPREPIIKVVAPIMEAQLVETAILNIVNHQSLIATKTARVVYAANGGGIMEFGLRRARGRMPDFTGRELHDRRLRRHIQCSGRTDV